MTFYKITLIYAAHVAHNTCVYCMKLQRTSKYWQKDIYTSYIHPWYFDWIRKVNIGITLGRHMYYIDRKEENKTNKKAITVTRKPHMQCRCWHWQIRYLHALFLSYHLCIIYLELMIFFLLPAVRYTKNELWLGFWQA